MAEPGTDRAFLKPQNAKSEIHWSLPPADGRAGLRLEMPDANIHTVGPVLARLGAVLYRTELPNGKVILAHLSKRLADAGAGFETGQRVVLELTPYDFDQARIIAEADSDTEGTAL
jgi:translation initiation factor IF-1